jgi:sugar lactone lactonase YvrE
MPHTITTAFTAPGSQPNGLQATPAGLWLLDQSTNQIHFVAYNGAVMKTLETAADRGSGITDSGEALWVASTYSCQILKLDRMTGATLAAYPSPGAGQTGAHGLEWRNNLLWIANPPTATIYQVDVSNGFQVMHSIPAPGNRPHGLAWVGDDLLCVETNHRAIYRLDPQTGAQRAKIEIPEPYPEPHGLSVWNGVGWYCDAHTRAVCRFVFEP